MPPLEGEQSAVKAAESKTATLNESKQPALQDTAPDPEEDDLDDLDGKN